MVKSMVNSFHRTGYPPIPEPLSLSRDNKSDYCPVDLLKSAVKINKMGRQEFLTLALTTVYMSTNDVQGVEELNWKNVIEEHCFKFTLFV